MRSESQWDLHSVRTNDSHDNDVNGLCSPRLRAAAVAAVVSVAAAGGAGAASTAADSAAAAGAAAVGGAGVCPVDTGAECSCACPCALAACPCPLLRRRWSVRAGRKEKRGRR